MGASSLYLHRQTRQVLHGKELKGCCRNGAILRMARGWHFGGNPWHISAIPKTPHPKYLLVEQFWGRAAQASPTQTESGRLSYFGSSCQLLVASKSRNRRVYG